MPRRLVSATLVLTLPGPVLVAYSGHAAAAALAPSATWSVAVHPGSGSVQASGAQPWSSPAVGDLFADGTKEVIAAFPDGSVWAWYATTGMLVSGWPQYTHGKVAASPALADLRGDGSKEIIVPSESGHVYVWDGHGNLMPGWPQSSHPRGSFSPAFFSSAAVADMFGDGRKEIAVGSWDIQLYVWFADGSSVPGFPKVLYDSVWDTPSLADLEHNGTLDVIEGADSSGGRTEPCPAGASYWAIRPDSSLVWRKCVGDQVAWASTAVADLNRDSNLKIVAGSGHYYPKPAGTNVRVLDSNGNGISGWPQPTGDRNFSSPAVGDVIGDGGREIVENSEDGKVYAWHPNGAALPGFPLGPNSGTLLTSPSIAPVDGSGRNGIWVTTGWAEILGYAGTGGAPVIDITPSGPLAGPIWSSPTVADLGNGHLSVVVTSFSSDQTYWSVRAYPIPGTSSTLPAGAWPTFHGNVARTGTEVPTAHVQPLAGTQSSAAFSVSWSLDSGSSTTTAYTVYVRDGSGPWVTWVSTPATAWTFHGFAGHTYSFYAQAWVGGDAPTPATGAQATTTISASPSNLPLFGGMYAVDAYGTLHPASSPPMPATYWPGWKIARSVALTPGGQSGYTMDGWGGIHSFGGASSISGFSYWPGWDIARSLALLPGSSAGGYTLDGWGGLHPFGGAPSFAPSAYWLGWDIARGLALCSAGGGYVLDGWGSVHPFGGAPPLSVSAYWPGWDIARGISVTADCSGGYVLDGWGGIHPLGSAPAVATSAYWYSWDIARSITLVPGTNNEGYVTDGWGGFHSFGNAPPVDVSNYMPGRDVIRGTSAS